MLQGLGFQSDVHLYVASGEVYGGEKTLAPLKVMFPNFHTKETLASQEELAPFSSFSSRMAALDFIVCDESNVFVTNNNGNMAKILAGRRYTCYIHIMIITPLIDGLPNIIKQLIQFQALTQYISLLQEILWSQTNNPTKH